jgi:hypothetical protein
MGTTSKKQSKSKTRATKKATKEQIQQILLEEEVEKVLRMENYAMLMNLLQKKDEDTLNIFNDYLQTEDSEYFITFIEGKTEDAL